jgi:rhodanese-related sulfurtransferase
MKCNDREVDAGTLRAWLQSGQAVLVDVREPFEHASERIEGSRHVPLAQIEPDTLRAEHMGERLVFHCRSGARSGKALEKCESALRQAGIETYHLRGGIEAWKAAGQPVAHSAGAPKLDIMRQVQIVAGSLVALGVLAGVLVSPWLLVVPGFVGCGLVFAGLSGWCGMAKLLARMPWNGGGGACERNP